MSATSPSMSVRFLDARTPPRVAWIAIALGCVGLAARPLTYGSLTTTVAVGLLGVLARPNDAASSRARWAGVVAFGTAVFAIARVFGSPAGVRVTSWGVVTLCVASVAEESFFRRYVYQWASRWGVTAAIAIGAVLFAVVHVPMYVLVTKTPVRNSQFPVRSASGA